MKTFLFLYASLLLIFVTSCNEKDYYDPDYQKVPEELSDLKVPSGFDWTTSSQLDLNLDINDQYSGSYYYKIHVFDKNPIISSDASLLAEGLAKKDEPFKGKITYSKSDSILYIQQTDPSGIRTVNALYVANGTKAISASTLKSASTKSANLDYTMPTRTYTTPSNAIRISGNSPYYIRNNNASFVIPAGQTFEGEIINDYYYNVFVYVEGTWKNTANQSSFNNVKLIIQNGGKYIPTQTSSSIRLNGSSKIVVAATGEFNSDKKEVNVEMNNESPQIINNSATFNINNILNIKELFNYGTMLVSGTISSNTSGVTIVNESSLTAQNLSLNGANIINTCKFVVNETATLLNNVTINIAAEKLFKSKFVVMGGNNTIALDSHAILDVTNELQFQNTQNYIKGPESGNKALLRLEKFSITEWRKPTFSGYLQIESSNYPVNKDATAYNLPQDSKYVDFVRKGESTIVILATDCNGGGNTPRTSNPIPVTYPLNVTLGTTYTYAFEDNYPKIGDYDMNDLVLDVNLGYTLSAANKVSDVVIHAKVRALGATKRLAAAIQLDGIAKENIKSVSSTNTTFRGDVFSVTNGLENNQDYAVIPITDNAHGLFGIDVSQMINTKVGQSHLPAKDLTFNIAFNQPIDISSVSLIDMLNIFIINGGYSASNRMEVHLRGYHATKKSTDVSSGKNYSTSDFVYAIRVPKSFKYPIEAIMITKAYPQFATWVSSNGVTNPNWYDTYDTNKVYLLEE